MTLGDRKRMAVVLEEPDGLSLRLSFDDSTSRRTVLHAKLSGGGLVAESAADLESPALGQFFADVATGTAPGLGRWEYKGDDDSILLHAGPDENGIRLTVDLLATNDDASDWQVNGTILVPLAVWQSAAAQVARAVK